MMTPVLKRLARRPAAGDVLVTMVARHYHIGRAQLVGDVLTAIGVTNRRADALALASGAATGQQRVFLFERAGSRHCVEIAGAKP